MPRPKPFLRLFFGFYGWCAAIALLAAALGVSIFVGSGEKAAHLRDAGDIANATVLTLTESHHRSGRHGNSHSYEVGYSFQVGSRTYTATDTVPRDRFQTLSQGDSIPVRYWTEDPNQSEIDIGDAASDSRVGLGLAIAASSAALFLGGIAWRDAVQARWMAVHGQRNEVEITGHAKTSVRVNGFPLWRAEWRNPDGTLGTSDRRFSASLPKVGAKVAVLTDPQGRRRSRLLSDVCN